MPDSAPDDEPKRKRTRRKSGGANDPRPVASVDMATGYLEGQLRRDNPGSWTADRLNQSQHNDGVTYVAINALMTAVRSSTVQINRKRKPIAFDSEGISRVVKSLPTPGSKGDSKKHVPFDDEKNPLVRLINRPNPTETINELLAQLVQQIMLTGSGLMWMNVDSLTLPRELYVLPTALCQAQPPSPAYPYGYWRVTSYYPAGAFGLLPYPGAGGGVPIDARNIMRFKQPHPLWRWDALSPLTAGAVQLTILEAIDTARQSAMESGLTADMFITAMGQSQEQMNAWMEILKQNNMGKRNHRKTVALGGESSEKGDVKVQFPNNSIKDMDFSQGWDQMSGFCLSLFGVPKAVANFTDASSYAQLFAALKQFHTLTLVPLAQWLSQWLTRHLCQDCFGEEFSIQIDVPAIDDADMAEKKRNTNLSNGLLMYNEARAQEGLSPVEGGDDLITSVFVQVQTAKAMAAAQPQPAPAAPGQPAPTPGDPNAAPPAQGEQQPDSTAAPGESLPTDPLSSLTGEGREPDSESLPDETNAQDAGDETSSTQDAVTNAALSALGITSDKGDGASESDDSPIPQNRIAKAYLANGNGYANGNGNWHYLKAAVPVTKPGGAAKPKTPAGTPNPGVDAHKHQEGEKWQGPSGHWFTIKNKRAIPISAPGSSESLPSPPSREQEDAAAKQAISSKLGKSSASIPDLDAQAKAFLNGRPSQKLLATGSGKTRVHEIKDGASLKAYYADGGKLPTPVLATAAKSIPTSTPAAQKALATVDEWAEKQASKYADDVAAHFLISSRRAHEILTAAMKQVAAHAAKTGKTAGISIKLNGKTVGIGPKKTPAPAPSQPPKPTPTLPPSRTAAGPSLPKPANPSGKGSLPSRPEPKATPVTPSRGVLGRAADHALKFLGTPAEQRLAKRRIASRSITKGIDGVSYGCVMLPMPADVTAACLEYIARIDDRDMIEPEGEPHVTLLYGLTDPDPQPVADILETHPPVPLAFGAFSLFTSPEHDVLKVDVESLPLRRLHGQLASLPHESSYPNYKPHLTIGYLKPGTGAYYAALFGSFSIPHGIATEAIYSDADHEETTIPFAGSTVTKAAMSAYSDSTGGALIAPAAQTPLVPSVRGKKKKRRPLATLCKSILAELDGDETAPVPELLPELTAVLSSLTGSVFASATD